MSSVLERLRHLRADTQGAVNTDWVLLCGALVSMAIIASSTFGKGSSEHAERIEGCLTAMSDVVGVTDDAQARAETMQDACNDGAAKS